MALHFTYRQSESGADLQQGDILQRTPNLQNVIEKIHPYYLHPDYRYFVVLTQSCDLVKGREATRYITLGAVRPLAEVIARETSKYQRNYVSKLANVAPESVKERVKQFLERLLNNNEPEYFYLHEDAQAGLSQPHCVFLRLSVPLHFSHYDTCRDARMVSLDSTFQAKLGWLVGNIYSRVGTDDWVPKARNAEQWKALIEDILVRNVVFMNDKKMEYVKKNNTEADLAAKPEQEIRDLIANSPEQKRKAEAIEVFIKVLADDAISAPDQIKYRRRLENDPALASLFK